MTDWEKYKNLDKPKLKLNEYRLVKINHKLYLEVKTESHKITFLTDLKYFNLIQNYTWYVWHINENRNTYYVETHDKNKHIRFHRLIKPECKMIDYVNRNGLDNRECNLRETTPRDNQLNCRLRKNNSSGYNGVCYHKKNKRWEFNWYENKKRRVKYFKVKEEAIKFKLEHDKITGNLNGYSISKNI